MTYRPPSWFSARRWHLTVRFQAVRFRRWLANQRTKLSAIWSIARGRPVIYGDTADYRRMRKWLNARHRERIL